ncbi:hypothetical protein DQS59_07860 [Salmonella enterica subsp. enterica serovar Malstatt]|nr:hypothetical protein [Salmonella enterica subsp. enterica serovar Agbeni]EBW9963541.1 hypothetical protein [Salmonella enterica subsp. enterica serovar Malstatt]ECI5561528.1 hypothetical protein [Salmonella enterica subsp. enterica]EBW3020704.1 hypothetical protein [Salmonella enterica subsp. enterica serovar Agbeni]EBX7668809.1 hypothetical protein [Salmonella enterica subsp. enterica serovar Agbeni]
MLLGTHSLAAFKQLELFWVYTGVSGGDHTFMLIPAPPPSLIIAGRRKVNIEPGKLAITLFYYPRTDFLCHSQPSIKINSRPP